MQRSPYRPEKSTTGAGVPLATLTILVLILTACASTGPSSSPASSIPKVAEGTITSTSSIAATTDVCNLGGTRAEVKKAMTPLTTGSWLSLAGTGGRPEVEATVTGNDGELQIEGPSSDVTTVTLEVFYTTNTGEDTRAATALHVLSAVAQWAGGSGASAWIAALLQGADHREAVAPSNVMTFGTVSMDYTPPQRLSGTPLSPATLSIWSSAGNCQARG